MGIFNLPENSIFEEYRYVQYLLWEKGIKIYSINSSFIKFFRDRITRYISEEGNTIQYILDYGMSNELCLNTAEDYREYLATIPRIHKHAF